MLTLATAYLIKVVLNPTSRGEGELYPVAMWFVAIFLDVALVMTALLIWRASCG